MFFQIVLVILIGAYWYWNGKVIQDFGGFFLMLALAISVLSAISPLVLFSAFSFHSKRYGAKLYFNLSAFFLSMLLSIVIYTLYVEIVLYFP